MLVTGVAQLIVAPVAAALVRRFDERLLTAFGFLLFGIGLGLSSVQTTATDFDEMFWPQLVRGCAIMSSDDLHNRIKSDVAKWSQVIEKAGIKKR